MTSNQAYGLAGQLNGTISTLNLVSSKLESANKAIDTNVVGTLGDAIKDSINSRKQEIESIISHINSSISNIKAYAAVLKKQEDSKKRKPKINLDDDYIKISDLRRL